jgi:hypothetical protein
MLRKERLLFIWFIFISNLDVTQPTSEKSKIGNRNTLHILTSAEVTQKLESRFWTYVLHRAAESRARLSAKNLSQVEGMRRAEQVEHETGTPNVYVFRRSLLVYDE